MKILLEPYKRLSNNETKGFFAFIILYIHKPACTCCDIVPISQLMFWKNMSENEQQKHNLQSIKRFALV